MQFKRILLFSIAIAALMASQSFSITGRVVDGGGSPVPNAYITYNSLDNRLLWAYSDGDGNFTLNDPGNTGVEEKIQNEILSNGLNASVRENLISFSPAGKKASISLFDLKGKNIYTKNFSGLKGERVSINPFKEIGTEISSSAYILEIKSRGQKTVIRMINLGNGLLSGKRSSVVNNSLSGNSNPLAKGMQSGEIRVGKTGYSPTLASYTSYTDNVGDVSIAARDIEALVDSMVDIYVNHANSSQLLGGQTILAPNVSASDVLRFDPSCAFYGIDNSQSHSNRRDFSNSAIEAAMQDDANHVPDPLIWSGDAVHGFINPPEGGVVTPHNHGLGCSFDPDIVEKCYRITALESRGAGMNWTFAPTADVARNNRYGRVYECFSEDPQHVARMIKAAVLGLQGGDLSHPWTIGATVKHFAGAGGTENGAQFGTTNTGTDAVQREIHLAPYEAAIEVGTGAVMAAFNKWENDEGEQIPMHGNKELLVNTLKGTMGFDGFVFGDYEAHWYAQGYFTDTLSQYEGTYGSPPGVRPILGSIIIANGVDVPLGGGIASNWDWAPNAKLAIDDGWMSQDVAVGVARRMLRAKFRSGLFENPYFSTDLTDIMKSDAHKAVAREAVRKTLVCLKNESSTLPLSKSANIHVVGTWADNMGMQCGGWTLGWQGNTETDSPVGTSIKEALENVASANGGNVTYSASSAGIPGDADVVVVAVGEVPYSETQGEHLSNASGDLSMYGGTQVTMVLEDTPEGDLINNVAGATDKPVVGLLVSGRPMVLGSSLDNSDAFVCAWLPGTEGQGVADVLFGDYDFTGKLAFSWPSAVADEPVNYGDYGDEDTGAQPLFPYGYGLNLAGEELPSGMYE